MSLALPRDSPRRQLHFSWIGFSLLSVAVGGMQLLLARGQRLDWFEASEIQMLLFVS